MSKDNMRSTEMVRIGEGVNNLNNSLLHPRWVSPDPGENERRHNKQSKLSAETEAVEHKTIRFGFRLNRQEPSIGENSLPASTRLNQDFRGSWYLLLLSVRENFHVIVMLLTLNTGVNLFRQLPIRTKLNHHFQKAEILKFA